MTHSQSTASAATSGQHHRSVAATADTVPDDTSSTFTIEVDGDHVVSAIDTVGDQDFFQVQLEAGHIYDIGQYLVTDGPSGVPLSDAYIEIYDSNGNLITSDINGDAVADFQVELVGRFNLAANDFIL